MEIKRVTLFAGHYGSGKTNIAVNFALYLRKLGKKVAIADLDIVNPYFRTKDSAKELAEAGVDLISPQFANSNVDLPALPAEAYRLVEDRSLSPGRRRRRWRSCGRARRREAFPSPPLSTTQTWPMRPQRTMSWPPWTTWRSSPASAACRCG